MRNVFLSHIHEDDAAIEAFKSLLADNGYTVRDSSVDSSSPNSANNADYIKYQILAPRIDWAGTVVVLLSGQTASSRWVEWEIEYAERKGKTVVGVWLPGEYGSDLPAPLEKYADSVVAWDAESIVRAMEGERINEQPDGTRRPSGPLARAEC